jgi:hypothetical protein
MPNLNKEPIKIHQDPVVYEQQPQQEVVEEVVVEEQPQEETPEASS